MLCRLSFLHSGHYSWSFHVTFFIERRNFRLPSTTFLNSISWNMCAASVHHEVIISEYGNIISFHNAKAELLTVTAGRHVYYNSDLGNGRPTR